MEAHRQENQEEAQAMIHPKIMEKLMACRRPDRVIRPCDPEWFSMPENVFDEVKAIITDAAAQKKCNPNDFCVEARFVGEKLAMVRIVDKIPKRLNGWPRVKAAWNIIWKGRI